MQALDWRLAALYRQVEGKLQQQRQQQQQQQQQGVSKQVLVHELSVQQQQQQREELALHFTDVPLSGGSSGSCTAIMCPICEDACLRAAGLHRELQRAGLGSAARGAAALTAGFMVMQPQLAQ